MRKNPFVKRTIVSVLCVALLLTGNLSTLASEIGEMVTEATEMTEVTEVTESVETEVTEIATETLETEVETETLPEENTKKDNLFTSFLSNVASAFSLNDDVMLLANNDATVYSLIWKRDKSNTNYIANIYLVDQNGNAISSNLVSNPPSWGQLNSSNNLKALYNEDSEYANYFSRIANDLNVQGYEYLATHIDSISGETVDNISFNYQCDSYRYWYTYYYSWYYVKNGSWLKWGNAQLDNQAETTKNVYMVFKPLNIDVTFDANGGTFANNESKIVISAPATKTGGYLHTVNGVNKGYIPSREGYIFMGWNTDKNATTASVQYIDTNPVNASDSYMYAIWKSVSGDKLITTVDTISKGVTINLFDYKVNDANATEEYVDDNADTRMSKGINTNHNLKFLDGTSAGYPNQNKYTNGPDAYQNIVKRDLVNGYPVLNGWKYNNSFATDESLDYLFNSTTSDYKSAHLNLNHLFTLDENGYYEYDSDKNFATLAGSNGKDFIIYNQSGNGFFPFTDENHMNDGKGASYDILDSSYVNHFFGMNVSTDFIQPKDGMVNNQNMKFEFSGDDDVWVYIDGKLALDLGGIHQKVSGYIDFATGTVWVEKANGTSNVSTTFESIFNAEDLVEKTINGVTYKTFEDYTSHTMDMFYLERGATASNCKIKYNLQTIPKGSLYVSKTATNVAEGDTSDYEFVVKDSSGNVVKNASYTIGTSSTVKYTDENGKFTLKSGEYAVITGLDEGTYTVTETDVKNSNNDYVLSDFGTRITVNSQTSVAITAASGRERSASVQISDATISVVDFNNVRITEDVKESESTLSKVIKYDDSDDTYDLTLSFKAPNKEITKTEIEETTTTEKALVDIVLVMDMSGSMADGFTNNGKQAATYNLSNSKTAVSKMVETLNAKQNTVDAQWKLVTFSSSASIKTDNWISSNSLNELVNNLSNPTGGTNYQDALVKAQSAIETSTRADASKIIVFVTDGEPTYYLKKGNKVDNTGNATQGGGDHTTANDYNGAIKGAGVVNCDTFYAVGIGLQNNVYKLNNKNISGLDLLKNVANATQATDKSAVNKQPSELGSLFADIAGEIITKSESYITKTHKYASNVTLTDALSEYVDIVNDSDVVISVKDASGNEVGTCTNGKLGTSNATYTFKNDDKDVTLTASYSNKVVTFDFPDDYELVEDYTYAVTFTVKSSEVAYDEYATTGYAHTGDANTDAEGNATSSGKKGFHSNNEAKVTYTFNGKDESENFDHPVVQVNAAKLKLVKRDEQNKAALSGVTFTLYKGDDKTGVEKTTDSNGTLDFGYLTSGTYRLVETAAPEKYSVLEEELTFTVSKGVITFATEVDEHYTLPNAVVTTAISDVNIVNTNENVYTVTVVNDLARIYEWNIYKISSSSTPDNMLYLEGAEFTLSSSDNTDNTYYGKSGSNGLVSWYAESTFETVVEEIAAGTYTLAETKAPTGYSVNAEWTLVIGKDNNISGYDVNRATYDKTTKTYTICYEDDAVYSLPETGGFGIFNYMFGGMFMMMAGALYIFLGRRNAFRA